jgi:TPR repeat protein
MMFAAGEEGLKPDPAQAVAWYRKSADQGFAEGQFKLAVLLAAGDGVARDLPRAAEWCRRAAEQGHPGAQYMLGIMFYRGDGVAKDPVESLAWLRLAERAGHPGSGKLIPSVQMALDAAGRAAADRRTEELARLLESRRK